MSVAQVFAEQTLPGDDAAMPAKSEEKSGAEEDGLGMSAHRPGQTRQAQTCRGLHGLIEHVADEMRAEAAQFLEVLQAEVRRLRLEASDILHNISSGVLTVDAAAEKPVFLVESGPAAGVIAATHLGGLWSAP